jgi:NAD(P)-dependent dehydrogenase (short-subunit alcohol dehydrogenase family)
VSSIFITGSADGLGREAARHLLDEGHQVVLHVRTQDRLVATRDLAPRALGIVIGDLASAAETRSVAEQVNRIGRMDAVIHNAGIYDSATRDATAEGHPRLLAVNTLAPYILTALMERPNRLVYLSSGMHRGGEGSLQDIDWLKRRWSATQAYSESKLHVAALAAGLARRWPEVLANAVDPGWVPTRMGGAHAPDKLEDGYRTQAWLAVSNDPASQASGGLWHHQRRIPPAAEVSDQDFQDQLIARLAALTGIQLP